MGKRVAKPSVAIRLGTEGKAAVKSDFADVGSSGEAAAKRLGDAFDREAQRADRARQNMAANAAKIAAITPQSPVQMRVSDTVGTGYGQWEQSAKASARAFLEAEQAQAQLEARTRSFLSAMDPAYAAQARFNSEMAEAKTLISAGAITLDQYCDKLRIERAALEQSTAAHKRHGVSMGQQRAIYQNLGFQVQDISQQLALGTPPLVILAQQGGQTASALSGLAESQNKVTATFGKFAGFIAGPWGAAITGGMLVIAALSGSLWENEKAAKAAEAGSDGLGNAQSVLAGIFDMTSGKIKNQNELLILNARLMAIQLRADASKREASSAGTFNAGGSFNFLDRMYGAYIDPQGEGLKMRRAAGAQQALIRDLQSGKLSPDQAMQAAEKLDYSGLTVTRDQLMQAIIDSSQSGLLRRTAELIDQSLNDKSLAPSLRTTPPPKRERSGSEREKREKYEWDRPIVEPVNRSFFAEVAQMEREREEAAKNRAAYAQQIVDRQSDDIALMKIEAGLIGANETTRRDILEIESLKLDLARAGVQTWQIEYQMALKTLEARQEYGRTIADQSRDWKETQRIGENFIDTVLNPDNWKDWGDLGKKILKDLYLDMLRLAAINPLKNMLFGSELPTMGGVFGSLGKIGGGGGGNGYMEGDGGLLGFLKKPSSGFAAGTYYFTGGMATVGENGPENVLLPRGSRIMTAADTRRMMGNGGGMSISMPITIDATGADAAGLARVEQKLDMLRAELPAQILSTVNDGRQRGFIR